MWNDSAARERSTWLEFNAIELELLYIKNLSMQNHQNCVKIVNSGSMSEVQTIALSICSKHIDSYRHSVCPPLENTTADYISKMIGHKD